MLPAPPDDDVRRLRPVPPDDDTPHARTAARLAAARERSGLERDALARALVPPMSENTIRHWEAGHGGPIGDHRRQLAHLLDVPVFVLWPPSELARSLSLAARRILLQASVRNAQRVTIAPTQHDRAAARDLARKWLAEDEGVSPDTGVHTMRLTGLGADVLAVLTAGET